MTEPPIRVAIHGAAGRMGRRLVELAREEDGLEPVAAIERCDHEQIGDSLGGLTIGSGLDAAADVMIDFSTPEATGRIAEACAARGLPLVIGTTGLGASQQEQIRAASASVGVVVASNFSLVVNVLNVLAARAARMLGPAYDVEILEAHHRFKKDAPSGTALTLARAICDATDRSFERDVVFTRHGDDAPRRPNEITIQALRIGDHVGEHTAFFAALGERLELRHVSTSRDSYVRGALAAARWLIGRPAGLYGMKDVLGLE